MTTKMQSVRLYAAGDIRIEEIDRPVISSPDDVLLKVTAAGICGSDLHNFRTGQWISRSPSVAGHEFAGVVLEVFRKYRNQFKSLSFNRFYQLLFNEPLQLFRVIVILDTLITRIEIGDTRAEREAFGEIGNS